MAGMAGKSHLTHLFNDNRSQMTQSGFLSLIEYIKSCGCEISEDNFKISEKIDGSTTLIGIDSEGLFIEKFGTTEKFRPGTEQSMPGKARALLDIVNKPDLIDFLDDVRQEYNMDFVKVQFEMLLSAFSRSQDKLQVILVPYDKEKFGSEGGGFIVRVIGDDLQPLPSQEELKSAIASILNSPEFIVHSIEECNLHYEPFNIEDFVTDFEVKLMNAGKNKKEVIQNGQKELQSLLTSHFPNGNYGEFYEGLVVTCGDGTMFKMTSDKFKTLINAHNERPTFDVSNQEFGLVKQETNGKEILLNHIGPGTEIVGILFGHFAPFTGPKGHGRMVEALREKGAHKFIIAIPDSTAAFDDDRAMYTVEQRLEICDAYLKSEDLEGKAVKLRRGEPKITVKGLIWDAYNTFGPKIRPVYVVGPDRADLFFKNKEFGTDETTTFPEKMVLQDRGEGAVSGTKVRELIRNEDVDGVAQMTGYPREVAQLLVDLRNDNLMDE